MHVSIPIAEFEAKMKDQTISNEEILRRYVIDTPPFIHTSEEYTQMRCDIASKWGVYFADVHMVGSGRIGFSLAPDKEWKPFSEESDIDVAIVSSSLFDKFMWEICSSNEIRHGGTVMSRNFNMASLSFFISKGWIRPEFMKENREWFEFFEEISKKAYAKGHPIKCGIFKDYRYFETFYIYPIQTIRTKLFSV